MADLPSGYGNRDLSQGGTTEYAGALPDVEAGTVLDVVEGYTDSDVCEIASFGDLNSLTTAQGVVVAQQFREWTLDHLDFSFDDIVTDVRTVTITVYRVPVGTKYADLSSDERIGAACTFVTSAFNGDGQRLSLQLHNLSEQARRFGRGEQLYVTIGANGSQDLGVTTVACQGRQRRA